MKAINGPTGSSVVDGLLKWVTDYGAYVIVVGVILLFLIPVGVAVIERRRAAVAAAASAALAVMIDQPIGHWLDRARPYDAHGQVHLLVAPSADPSFPSDHASAACAIALVVLLYGRRLGWWFVAAAVLLGFSRVFVGIHYPGDVLGGAAIGMLVALIVCRTPVRLLVDRVADRAGALYDRLLSLFGLNRPLQPD